MINLLPEKDKKNVQNEYIRRFMVVMGLGSAVIILAQIIFSLIGYFQVVSIAKENEEQLRDAEDYARVARVDEMETEIKKISQFLSDLKTAENESENITDDISMVLGLLPEDSRISQIIFEGSPTGGSFRIAGWTPGRDSLLKFLDNLKTVKCGGDTCFSEVLSPVSNLLRDKDIDFSLEAKIKMADAEK